MAHTSSWYTEEKTTNGEEASGYRGSIVTTGRVRASGAPWGLCTFCSGDAHRKGGWKEKKTHPVPHRVDNSALVGTKTKVSFQAISFFSLPLLPPTFSTWRVFSVSYRHCGENIPGFPPSKGSKVRRTQCFLKQGARAGKQLKTAWAANCTGIPFVLCNSVAPKDSKVP